MKCFPPSLTDEELYTASFLSSRKIFSSKIYEMVCRFPEHKENFETTFRKICLKKFTLIGYQGFYGGSCGRSFGENRSTGTDDPRAGAPEIRAWVTSTSWSKMDAVIYGLFEGARVN
jgi:hypothetical protein